MTVTRQTGLTQCNAHMATALEPELSPRTAQPAARQPRAPLQSDSPPARPLDTERSFRDDVHRFPSAAHLASWCGLTPRHREPDTTVRRGPITKQGSKLIRWAAVEAAQRLGRDTWLYAQRERLAERRNSRAVAKTAIARKLVTLAYYGLRDGEIRCLDRQLSRVA